MTLTKKIITQLSQKSQPDDVLHSNQCQTSTSLDEDHFGRSGDLTVVALQMNSIDDPVKNLEQCLSLAAKALESGHVDLFCLPENCLSFRIDPKQKDFYLSKENQIFEQICTFAKLHRVAFHIGATPMFDSEKANRALWISKLGVLTSVYDKIHLFDVDVIGQKPVRESDSFISGQRIAIGEFEGWKIGFAICYDIRFSELFARFAREKVDLILIPSAFLVTTGESHWEILNRARAIESQCYVISAAQAGTHISILSSVNPSVPPEGSESFKRSSTNDSLVIASENAIGKEAEKTGNEVDNATLKNVLSRNTYGSTMIVDPWGIVLAKASSFTEFDGPSWIAANLSKARLNQVRQQIPMVNHRREISFYFETDAENFFLD